MADIFHLLSLLGFWHILWILFAVVTITIVVINHLKNREDVELINKIPGPEPRFFFGNVGGILWAILKLRSHDISPNSIILQAMCGTVHLYQEDRLYRIWSLMFPHITLFKPESVEVILSSNSNTEKSEDYKLLHPWLGTGLLTSTGNKWRTRRKLLTPAFHFRILEDVLSVINEQTSIYIRRLEEECEKDFVNIVPLNTFLTLDIICESAMGVCIGAQRNSESEYVTAIKSVSEDFLYRMIRPWLWNNTFYMLLPQARKYKKSLNILHNFTSQVIKEKKEQLLQQKQNPNKQQSEDRASDVGIKNRKAFLDLLLDHHINDHSLTERDIQEEVDTFMFEGHDTTAMGITWAMYLIGLYPEVQVKIQEEIDAIFGDDKERSVTSDDLRDMKYLDCVLKESQRLYPSVPFISRKLKEKAILNGYTVPANTDCFVFIYMLHRNPEVFPNPEVFNPDNFLPENCIDRNPFAYVPFSAGPRNCIGQKFAVMEEKTVVANVLRNFNIHSLDPRDKVQPVGELVLRPYKGLRLKFTKR